MKTNFLMCFKKKKFIGLFWEASEIPVSAAFKVGARKFHFPKYKKSFQSLFLFAL